MGKMAGGTGTLPHLPPCRFPEGARDAGDTAFTPAGSGVIVRVLVFSRIPEPQA